MIHIYTAALQPATRYKLDMGTKRARYMWITAKPRALIWAECCRKLHWAQNLKAQAYYDSTYFWCCDGKGCKK